eukprot:11225808-Lingulodinium_polyedra.AAC.1
MPPQQQNEGADSFMNGRSADFDAAKRAAIDFEASERRVLGPQLEVGGGMVGDFEEAPRARAPRARSVQRQTGQAAEARAPQ